MRVNSEKFASYRDRLIQFGDKYKKPIRLLTWLLWIILFGFIFWSGWRSHDQLMPYLEHANPLIFIWVVFYYLLALVFTLLAWISIMHAFAPKIPFWTHIQIFLGTMAARRLPGTIWYIGGRAVFYKRLGISQIKTTSASGIELVISFIANCVVALVALPFGLNLAPVFIVLLSFGALGGLFLLLPKNIARMMLFLKRPMEQEVHLNQLFVWLFLRIAVVISGGLMVAQIWRIFQTLDSDQYLIILGARALSGAASMFTYFLPSSLGASDITLAAVLSSIMPVTVAALLVLAVRLLTTLFEVILGIVFTFIIKQPEG